MEYKGEVILLNKPLNWTSFDAVKKVRNALRNRYGEKYKVGHAGTLDPLATGLLIICTGRFTKNINQYQEMEKEYEGEMIIGAVRPSYDKETEISEHFPVEHITDELINKAAELFIGTIDQVPPDYSAIKVDGKRAYNNARQGISFTLHPRKVSIKLFEVNRILPSAPLPPAPQGGNNEVRIAFKVVCSKGTYIRSLARDFGLALKSGAYLDSLCRTRIGDFQVKDALLMENLPSFLPVA
jgi:tRNA pseudouridine55 synthase